MFFNRAAGRYETSAELSRYEHELVDNGLVKIARRSKRALHRKKMIDLLPELTQKTSRTDKHSKNKYQVTISVDSK